MLKKWLIAFACFLAVDGCMTPSPAFSATMFSKDIGGPAPVDTVNGATYKKAKIAFGADGTATDVSASNPLPVTASITQTLYDVFQWMDSVNVLDASVTNIPASASAALTVVSSLTGSVHEIEINDTTGKYVDVYDNTALAYVISPGLQQTVPVSIASGHAVKIRADAVNSAAITTGTLALQFR